MALAPLLYNITFDSQTRILYFWDKAGHEIYHCEVPSPAPSLPTVSWQFIYPNSDQTGYDSPPNFTRVYFDSDGSRIPYDSNVKYGLRLSSSIDGRLSIANSNNWVAVSRSGGSGYVTIFRLSLYICSSSSATVITVYDSSNNPYNAFKYISDGTDYYYVLDGTQTDWTDDLASIGYHVDEYLDLIVGIVYRDGVWLSRTFGANDYWYSGILSNDDKLRLEAFGSGAMEPGGSFGPIGNVFYNGGLFEYEVKALYSDLGSTEIITDISNFFVRAGGSFSTSAFINSINAFSTPVMSWKLRITKKQKS